MSDPTPRLELGTTKLFTVTYSTAPPSSPSFAVHVNSGLAAGSATLVYSVVGVTSNAGLTWGAFFTIPTSTQTLYSYTWTASYGAGVVIVRDRFQGVLTGAF